MKYLFSVLRKQKGRDEVKNLAQPPCPSRKCLFLFHSMKWNAVFFCRAPVENSPLIFRACWVIAPPFISLWFFLAVISHPWFIFLLVAVKKRRQGAIWPREKLRRREKNNGKGRNERGVSMTQHFRYKTEIFILSLRTISIVCLLILCVGYKGKNEFAWITVNQNNLQRNTLKREGRFFLDGKSRFYA